MYALTALRGPPHAPGDFQEAWSPPSQWEPTSSPQWKKEDRLAAKEHSSHDNIVPNKTNVIRPCYFILSPFHEWRKVTTKRPPLEGTARRRPTRDTWEEAGDVPSHRPLRASEPTCLTQRSGARTEA